jgi:TRAP-type C4-dicarboxylate transport system permease small subunit
LNSIAKGYLKLMGALDRVVKWFSILMAFAMAAVVVLQVASRMMPWFPTPPWTEELARYLMLYMAFVAASAGIKRWNNIGVDFFLNRMPPRVKHFVEVAIEVLVLVFLVYLTYLSATVFPKVSMRQKSATMGFPMFVPQFAIILGSALMSLQMIGVILRRFLKEGTQDV